MPKSICSHKDCNRVVVALSYCSKHYQQFKKYGKIKENTCMDLNEVIDKDYYYEIILTDKRGKEKGKARIDKEDLAKVQAIGRWKLRTDGYVYNSNKKILMHRLIMNAKYDEEVDHIKTGIKHRSDNRKKNLRSATRRQNEYNKGLTVNNTSGFKGVSFNTENNKWRVRINVNGKSKHLGYFDTIEVANSVYTEFAKKLHKDFYHSNILL